MGSLLRGFASGDIDDMFKVDDFGGGFGFSQPDLLGVSTGGKAQLAPASPTSAMLPSMLGPFADSMETFDSSGNSDDIDIFLPVIGQTAKASSVRGGTAAAAAAAALPPTDPDAIADPKERRRAKNRQSQARYREKLKAQRQEAEDAYESASQDLQRLKLEQEMLMERKIAMESMLGVRDQAVRCLEQGKATSEGTQAAPPKPQFGGVQPPALPAPSKEVGKSNQERISAAFSQGCIPPTQSNACPIQRLSPAEIREMHLVSHEAVQSRYGGIVKTLKACLTVIEDAGAPAGERTAAERTMMTTLWECGCMCFDQAISNPTNLHKLLAASVGDDGGPLSLGGASSFAALTHALGLSPEQRACMKAPLDNFRSRQERITVDRARLLGAFRGDQPTAGEVGAGAGGSTPTARLADPSTRSSQNDGARGWLAMHDAAAELQANLLEEHLACVELLSRVFGRVLTPLQKTKAVVMSYPAFPDVLAIATAAMEEMEEGSA